MMVLSRDYRAQLSHAIGLGMDPQSDAIICLLVWCKSPASITTRLETQVQYSEGSGAMSIEGRKEKVVMEGKVVMVSEHSSNFEELRRSLGIQ